MTIDAINRQHGGVEMQAEAYLMTFPRQTDEGVKFNIISQKPITDGDEIDTPTIVYAVKNSEFVCKVNKNEHYSYYKIN